VLLDERHRDIAQIALAAAGRRYGVALAGGGALQVHEVSARSTQDVDLFVKRAGQVGDAAAAIGEALELAGYKVAVPYAGEGMIEFEVSPPPGGGDPVQVQVAHFAYGATVDTVVGPTVTLDYLAARKAVALMERHQVRDYVDIASLVDAGYGIGALLEMAFREAPYLEAADAGDAGAHLDMISDQRLERELPAGKTAGWVRAALAGWPRQPVHEG
jgi:Nucleotidyl transferase AbiEii toxin, Type IV TA system